ncbi:g7184 [Coccomyxa viridis]|uniref:G7184 protein n=1 Tax=Coccomyxa viridis TaxID=1274662 RepID=A0ABP1FZK8_9CHLO
MTEQFKVFIYTYAALKSINKANEADLGEALDYLGFEIVDGHMYGLRDERFKLPKPVEGTLKCSTFDPNDKGRNFDKALAEHHKKYLEGLEVPMGKDGYNVLELIHMRGAVDILIGAKRYMGSLASAVVPNITTDLSADHYSRVGFVHMHRNKDAVVISMLAIMFKTDMPLDFVSTDGVTYILYRFHKMKLLKYEQLSAEEAYYAVAERLKKDIKVKIAMPYPIGDLLKEFPEEETMAHRILKEMLPSKRY